MEELAQEGVHVDISPEAGARGSRIYTDDHDHREAA